MTGRELASACNYVGMERDIRNLAIKEKLAPVEQIASMTEVEVCELVAESYMCLYQEREEIGLVKKEDFAKAKNLVVTIHR